MGIKTKSDYEKTTVVTHGNTYSKQEEANDKYPFRLCPECMSDNTRVIPGTGGYRWSGKHSILFDHKIIFASYACDVCGCRWKYEYVDKKSKRGKEIDSMVAAFIIVLLIAILCLVLAVGLIPTVNDDSPLWVIIVAIVCILVNVLAIPMAFGLLDL